MRRHLIVLAIVFVFQFKSELFKYKDKIKDVAKRKGDYIIDVASRLSKDKIIDVAKRKGNYIKDVAKMHVALAGAVLLG